jgi:D-sedoheptulose 7-phosphate isomerase
MSFDFLSSLLERKPELGDCKADIAAAFNILKESFATGDKALLCGNGGSAADCEHWSGEMLKGFEGDRAVGPDMRARLGDDLADKLLGALPVIPLTGFMSLSSAYANDCHSAYIFAQLTLALGQAGDVLVALSTSGNSDNVLYAVQTARALGLRVVGLTGATGGRLRDLCDACICVPVERTYQIQELHLPVYHTLSLMLEAEFFEE